MAQLNLKSVPLILRGEFFEILECDNDKVTTKCKTCQSSIKGAISTTSNFTTHLQSQHPEKLKEYKELKEGGGGARKRQKLLDFPVLSRTSTESTRTAHLIAEYIIKSMSPLSTVESEPFKDLVKGLNSLASVPSAKTLRNRIMERFHATKHRIKSELQFVDWVCVTADVWSAHHRSYIGVTCHYLNPDMGRKSLVLALKRFKGSHTAERITEKLTEIFQDYEIQSKIVCVVTDNASNFVKAFTEYGVQFFEDEDKIDFPLEDEATKEDSEDEDDSVKRELQSEAEPDLTSMLDELQDPKLPPHFRCVSHTLSLVATTDLEKELEKKIPRKERSAANFKILLRSTFAKCAAFWNKVARSDQVAEQVTAVFSVSALTPVKTRWNAMYDCVSQLNKQFEKLDEAFDKAKVEKLKTSEKEFLKAYENGLAPVAWALDKLQGENSMFLGYVAPVLFKTRQKLCGIAQEDSNASHVAQALLVGLERRFQELFELSSSRKLEVLSAVLLPCFKLLWIPQDKREMFKTKFIAEVSKVDELEGSKLPPHDTSKKLDDPFSDDLFEFGEEKTSSCSSSIRSPELECVTYLNHQEKSLDALNLFPRLKKMSHKLNTGLPSSAPVERVFSYGKMILRPQRCRLTDSLFEALVFTKLND